ncbi:MAG TPA: bifunctional hydroxymethylpyrimidine kinase/phosphomethylpyrimidine kinase [Armatimonadota bacterium]|nr:bifunctional hydroxymethylpyrimidine kinase/phosphomethylpyrimidine kinase [Armatimonadota bacterium]
MGEPRIPRVLTIAGSDSSGGAGIQIDLKSFERLGVYGISAVTAVTAQNTVGVQKIHKVPPRIIAAQIDSVVLDIGVDACKVGMLYDPTAVDVVAERIHRREIPNVVLDPVIAAKDGTPLLANKGIERMKRSLIRRVLLVTPNVREAEMLSGIRVTGTEDLKEAAAAIHRMGCRYVLAKGGHLGGEPTDVLFDGERFVELPGVRIEGAEVHGTGCAFSAAIAARLALGDAVPDAARFAKAFVADLMRSAVKLGKGSSLIR